MDYKVAYALIESLVMSGATKEEIQKLTGMPLDVLNLVRVNKITTETADIQKNNNSVLQFIKTAEVPALSGKELRTIDKATDVFYYIDSDFKNCGLSNITQNKTEKTSAKLSELAEDASFKKMFIGNLSQLCMTQSQIISYCKNNKNDLSTTGATFFLTEDEQGNFFVVDVYVNSDGLDVYVNRLSDGHVWSACDEHRIVEAG